MLIEEPLFTVRAAVLDHGIPCLAFSLEEPFRINIDKDRLLKKNLSVGPWLTELRQKVREGTPAGSLVIGGKRFPVRRLVITSYSIHYTKLYDLDDGPVLFPSQRLNIFQHLSLLQARNILVLTFADSVRNEWQKLSDDLLF